MLGSCRRAVQRVVAKSPASVGVRALATDGPALEDRHQEWLAQVSKYPVVEPKFESTLEWVLPTPVPQHQFEESPIVIEVQNRNPENDHH